MPFGTHRARAWSPPRAPAAPSSPRASRRPALEVAAFRALQFGWFTTPLVMDEEDAICDRARARRRARRVGGRRRARRPRGQRGLRGRPRGGPDRRGRPDPRAGQGRGQRRARPLHGAVARLRDRRPAARGRRLPAPAGLRRVPRQPRPGARAHAAARRSCRGARRLPGGARHAGGRGDHDERQRRPGPRRGRARADRGRRPRGAPRGPRSATTRCGRRWPSASR